MNEIKTTPNPTQELTELTALYEISKTSMSSLDLNKVCSSILEVLAAKLGMKRGTLTLVDPFTNELAIEVAHGLTGEEMKRGRYKLGEGVTGTVAKTGEPMIIPNIGEEPLFANKTKSRGDVKRASISFLCVPVKIEDKVVGVLSVDRLFGDQVRFTEDVEFLTIIANSTIAPLVKLHRMIAAERKELMDENIQLREELRAKYRFENIVGNSDKMTAVFEAVATVAQSKATVLLQGESGTGKELIARAIHYNSPRRDKAFVKVSCGAIPESLLESELFGHVRGAFTGAIKDKPGKFELANEGTIFLDEIGDMSLALQVKLLRVLQEREFERVGGVETIKVDIRLIAATNRDLSMAVKEGTFREDLFYRLNVIPIFIPPLRERREDIPSLVAHFLKKFCLENDRKMEYVSPEAMSIMVGYGWPGNVRELENTIERAVVMGKGSKLLPEHLYLPAVDKGKGGVYPKGVDKEGVLVGIGDISGTGLDYHKVISEIERKIISEALQKCGGTQVKAAKLLGINRNTLRKKIEELNINL